MLSVIRSGNWATASSKAAADMGVGAGVGVGSAKAEALVEALSKGPVSGVTGLLVWATTDMRMTKPDQTARTIRKIFRPRRLGFCGMGGIYMA